MTHTSPARRRKRRWALLLAAVLLLTATGAGTPPPADDTPPVAFGALPLFLAEETREPGDLVVVKYTSHIEGGTVARAGIYLPYGYDPEERYDVVILWPGSSGDLNDALLSPEPCRMADGQTRPLSAMHVLDRLIETDAVRPLILVCMEEITQAELRIARRDLQDMLEYLAENYSIYIADDTLPAEEARRHFTFVGFSQGAIYTQALGMALNFDRFANFAAISFGSRWEQTAATVNASPYPLGMLYVLTGDETDFGAPNARNAYETLLRKCPDKVREGENAVFRQTELYGHEYALIQVALWDLLPAVCPPEKAP